MSASLGLKCKPRNQRQPRGLPPAEPFSEDLAGQCDSANAGPAGAESIGQGFEPRAGGLAIPSAAFQQSAWFCAVEGTIGELRRDTGSSYHAPLDTEKPMTAMWFRAQRLFASNVVTAVSKWSRRCQAKLGEAAFSTSTGKVSDQPPVPSRHEVNGGPLAHAEQDLRVDAAHRISNANGFQAPYASPKLRSRLWLAAGTVTLVAACGGGDSPAPVQPPVVTPAPTPAPPPVPTTGVNVTVIDGPISNARVCFDVNGNGGCDAGEPGGVTDAAGKVTILIPTDSVGKYAVVAVVGTDAVDADTGPVNAPFTLLAPADKASVVSPLTTLVQHLVQTNGLTSAAAEQQIKGMTALSVSMFDDYTQMRASSADSANAGLLASVIALSVQKQYQALQGVIGKSDAAGSPIVKADVERAVRDAVVTALPDVAVNVAQPAVQDACKTGPGSAPCLAQLQSKASDVVANSGLTEDAVIALVPIMKTPEKPEETTGAAGALFRWLNYGGSPTADWYHRSVLFTAQEATPVNGFVKYRLARREQTAAFGFREWNHSRDYNRRNDAHWNGSAWVACPDATFQHTSAVRDANGRAAYDYCDSREKGVSQRSTESISGKTLAEVVKRIRAFPGEEGNLPYSRWGDPLDGPAWTSADLEGFFGNAVFPANSQLYFLTSASTATAYAYDVQSSNRIFLYSAEIAAGGDARNGNPACASAQNADILATKLEDLLTLKGTPCQFNPTAPNANYQGSGTPNDWYGNSTISLGRVGSEATGIPGPVVPAPHFTSNILLRVAFTGDTVDRKVTYYTCKERRSSPSTRNCTAIGSGTYDVVPLGDARIMKFNGLPLDTAALTYERIFVERNGAVYFGYRDKPRPFKPQVRLSLDAANAVLQKLGLSPIVP
jgi:HAMP domain-containing protein